MGHFILAHMLILPMENAYFTVYCDTSKVVLGGIFNKGKVIAHALC